MIIKIEGNDKTTISEEITNAKIVNDILTFQIKNTFEEMSIEPDEDNPLVVTLFSDTGSELLKKTIYNKGG